MVEKRNVVAVATELYNILEPLEPEDRQRSIAGALALLGVPGMIQNSVAPGTVGGASTAASTAAAFFNQKQPNNKIEELAVAARYREIQGSNTHTKEQL